jgi:hypothetical protein
LAKNFRDLSEQETLALAISLEETDARIYEDFAAGLNADYSATAQIFSEMEGGGGWHHVTAEKTSTRFGFDQSDRDGALGEIPHRAVAGRIEYGFEIRGCNLGGALGATKLGEGEHLLGSGGAAGDSFVGFNGIFERYRLYSRNL